MFSQLLLHPLIAGSILLNLVLANTEKIIISGPSPSSPIPSTFSKDLATIPLLTPVDWSIRHHIPAAFPSDSHPDGLSSWYLLGDLSPGQGYEIRICWAATQPTAFKFATYSPADVFDDPSLSESLTSYSESRMSALGLSPDDLTKDSPDPGQHVKAEKSALLLQIFAAADYFSANASLMSNVPPVFVDVILDPHVIPGVPRSLVPTIGCVLVVAVGSIFLARTVSSGLARIASGPQDGTKKQQ